MVIVKICKKHGQLPIELIFFSKDSEGYKYSRCRLCDRERKAVYRSKNQEKITRKIKEYYYRNPEKLTLKHKNSYSNNKEDIKKRKRDYYERLSKEEKRKRAIKYRENNIERVNKYSRDWYHKKGKHKYSAIAKINIDTLDDSYVKQLIRQYTSIRSHEIPKELIEAKKIYLKLKRKLKEIKNGNKQC